MRFLPYAVSILLMGCAGTANLTREQTAALELEKQQRAMQVLSVSETELRRLPDGYFTSRLVEGELRADAERYARDMGIRYEQALFRLCGRVDINGDRVIIPEELGTYRTSEKR